MADINILHDIIIDHKLCHIQENELKNVIEKQKPKKPNISIYKVAFCPNCNGSIWQNRDESKYCFRCGQSIDWSDT